MKEAVPQKGDDADTGVFVIRGYCPYITNGRSNKFRRAGLSYSCQL